MNGLPDPEAKNIVETTKKNNKTNRLYVNFIKFLIDFNVLGHSVGFIIAMALNKFLSEFTQDMLKNRINNQHYINLISLIVIVSLIFIFIEYIFYGIIYTPEISKERKLEKVLADNTKDDIKKELNIIPNYSSTSLIRN